MLKKAIKKRRKREGMIAAFLQRGLIMVVANHCPQLLTLKRTVKCTLWPA